MSEDLWRVQSVRSDVDVTFATGMPTMFAAPKYNAALEVSQHDADLVYLVEYMYVCYVGERCCSEFLYFFNFNNTNSCMLLAYWFILYCLLCVYCFITACNILFVAFPYISYQQQYVLLFSYHFQFFILVALQFTLLIASGCLKMYFVQQV